MLGFVARGRPAADDDPGGRLLAASTLVGAATPAAAQDPPAPAHWGNYQWFGGRETADVRAFWLVDRTGDRTLNAIIAWVAQAWNSARSTYPELPYIAV